MKTEHGVRLLVVEVDLLNDDGEKRSCTAAGQTVDQAVHEAEMGAQIETGDLSWTMSDWRAA